MEAPRKGESRRKCPVVQQSRCCVFVQRTRKQEIKERCSPAALFTVAEARERTKCPCRDARIKESWRGRTVEFYSDRTVNGISPFATTWTGLEVILPREKSDRERQTPSDLAYDVESCHAKPIRAERRLVAVGLGGGSRRKAHGGKPGGDGRGAQLPARDEHSWGPRAPRGVST